MKEIHIDELRSKLGTKKAFPVFKKKLNQKDMETVFDKKRLKSLSTGKNFTIGFGIFTLLSGLFTVNVVGLLVGVVFLLIGVFMKNPFEKFLLSQIKKDNDLLISSYEQGLVNFYLYGQGEIKYPETEVVLE